MQKQTSIEDQIRQGTRCADQNGWHIVMPYSDYAISGATRNREALQMLLQHASEGQFEIVITEGLDRLSRDQEDIAHIYKRLTFFGVKIYSLSDGGFVNEMHIGMKGTWNSMFLKDLAIKTHRGQRGQIERGKACGMRPYGYDVVRRFDAAGDPIRGERSINLDEAAIVQRIFNDYANGKSPLKIAIELNAEGIASPKDKGWSDISIRGKPKKGEGILNNELYIGRLVWNRVKYVTNPETGKKVKRINPKEDLTITDVPDLRVIEQAVWDQVKAKQEAVTRAPTLNQTHRPKGLLSHLIKCGCCSGGYTKINTNRYGCGNARSKRTCTNRISITQDKLENIVMDTLQNQLMQQELFNLFCVEYTAHTKRLNQGKTSNKTKLSRKLAKLNTEKDNIIKAVKAGFADAALKDELDDIIQAQEETQDALNRLEEEPVTVLPNMAGRYQDEVGQLRQNLRDNGYTQDAVNTVRSLVKKVVLTPDNTGKHLTIDVHGELAGLLAMATNQSNVTPLMLAFDDAQAQEDQAESQNENLFYRLSTASRLTNE
ncbi:MAG: recombinase family protein [Psychrosphaera sp.]|nr:recombinase family protein [Psychrosphaera sp.]